ncbi:TetR/AcrR family transcriptional regulator [Amycolatopsis sp. CA-230715]|uniref:TetR/AcrR family transcriptional regulator n=1 Tax=Amycolatopsis sp. CA-230715 TaxID=2745196 RepID=UPI001C01AFFA|nr:TetR/AcrR family transcriptional regulator [Amycolatopsis sp. CA-230715]QWF79258.1 hypothetical protein HUW46_02665 [Amycolatopsis sp. CA-230715]
MARPPEPGRRAATLAKATDYVLAHGLAGLSLRPMATALGTSTRMLLYDFGSKRTLVSELLAEARRRLGASLTGYLAEHDLSAAELVRLIWAWLTDAEQIPYLRLFFQVYTDAMTNPGDYADGGRGMVDDWLAVLADRFDPAAATLVVATLRGLVLDRMTATDPARVDAALERFAARLPRN